MAFKPSYCELYGSCPSAGPHHDWEEAEESMHFPSLLDMYNQFNWRDVYDATLMHPLWWPTTQV